MTNKPSSERLEEISRAQSQFGVLLEEIYSRIDKMIQTAEWVNYQELKPIIIGICPGDGIGPEICRHAQTVLENVLKEQIENNKIEFRQIEGLTIENRAKHKKAIPDDVLAALKECHVILKGPTTTPQAGSKWPNIESANVAMRRELDLFANIRPVKIPEDNIDWIFFRENTEGAYALGSKGLDLGNDFSIDFKIITQPGAERIIRLAFDYAKNNGKKKVTVVTKSNVIKKTDGRFSRLAKEIAKEYEQYGITSDEWYIDIMTAKLLDPARRTSFEVFVLPNLYGDIITDEAAQIQGGVGTAGSANIGKRYAMFEAIHGSAPRMVEEGRAKYADPSSMIKAAAMLLRHIGYQKEAEKIEMALEICTLYEKKLTITGRDNGATGAEFAQYLLNWVHREDLEEKWKKYSETN